VTRKAIFIDRDGTLIEERHHLVSSDQLHVFPQSIEALQLINQSGVLAILVTNQSVIARGLLTESGLAEIHRSLETSLAAKGVYLDGIYYCPHHPEAGTSSYTTDCACRKPAPGMLIRAARDFHLDLDSCVYIGDTLTDVEAGHRAGAVSVLVRTGYGSEVEAGLTKAERLSPQRYPDYIASDILQAVKWSLERIGEGKSL
jgi:D-glycero-D-manno-heptose 1,7-bisphosphate phosphatase